MTVIKVNKDETIIDWLNENCTKYIRDKNGNFIGVEVKNFNLHGKHKLVPNWIGNYAHAQSSDRQNQ